MIRWAKRVRHPTQLPALAFSGKPQPGYQLQVPLNLFVVLGVEDGGVEDVVDHPEVPASLVGRSFAAAVVPVDGP